MNSDPPIPLVEAVERLTREVELAEKTAHFLVRVDTADLRLILSALDAIENQKLVLEQFAEAAQARIAELEGIKSLSGKRG